MTYLARFPINKVRRGARKLLGSPQAMHAAVMSSFPPGAPPGRVLWRVDLDDNETALYVVSPEPPDFTHLIEQAGWPATPREPWQIGSYTGLLGRLAEGQAWAFRLRGNPVRAASDLGKRVPHVTADQQCQWLRERAPRLGFSIPETDGTPAVVVSDRQRISFRRGPDTVTLSTARFDGLLHVEDADSFRSSLINGIGRAKGYGCGLMTIIRPT